MQSTLVVIFVSVIVLGCVGLRILRSASSRPLELTVFLEVGDGRDIHDTADRDERRSFLALLAPLTF